MRRRLTSGDRRHSAHHVGDATISQHDRVEAQTTLELRSDEAVRQLESAAATRASY